MIPVDSLQVGGALHELYGAPCAMKKFALRVRVDVAKEQVCRPHRPPFLLILLLIPSGSCSESSPDLSSDPFSSLLIIPSDAHDPL